MTVGPVVTSQWSHCTVSFRRAPAKAGLPRVTSLLCSPTASAKTAHGPEAQAAGPEEGSRLPSGARGPQALGGSPCRAAYQTLGCPEENSNQQRGKGTYSPAERSAMEHEPQGTSLSLLFCHQHGKGKAEKPQRQALDQFPHSLHPTPPPADLTDVGNKCLPPIAPSVLSSRASVS